MHTPPPRVLSRPMLIGLSLAAALLVVGVAAGPLTPPLGPVTGTSKPLSEVEPRIAINATNTPGNATAVFRITAAGSYYLTGNVTGDSGKSGISIATTAGDVTIDLNGFELIGLAGSTTGITTSTVGQTGIRIFNGTIRNWGVNGIAVNLASNGVVDQVLVSGSGGNGIHVGANFTVSDCVVTGNGANGLVVGSNCTVTRCVAEGNSGVGISTGGGCVLTECASDGNALSGINPGSGSIARACVSSNNATNGFDGVFRVVIEGCSAVTNSGIGINMSNACEIRNCTVTASNPTSSAGGIQVGTGCLVRGNFCRNTAVGVQTTSTDNVIVANHFAGHTNAYIITASNHFGPFIVSGTNAAAISGNAAQASNMGSADPNANFID